MYLRFKPSLRSQKIALCVDHGVLSVCASFRISI